MDSQDSSAPPPPPPHHHHHHHHPQPHPQPPFSAHHAMMMGHQQPQIQQHSNNSYLLPNNNNSALPTTSATSNSTMMLHHHHHHHQQLPNPRFPFNSMPPAPAPKPMDHQFSDGSPSGGSAAAGWFAAEPPRKKRGRPRKYSPDNSIGLGLSPAPGTQISPAGGHVDPGGSGGTPSSDTSVKRHRGRPPGSSKKQLDALGIPGIGFTPHVITVNAGEDIASKIMTFSQQGPRTVCILSANGAICNVTLRQPAVSGGAVSYEGRYEIISLSGSFPTSESNGSRTGGLSVSLAGSDGRVVGGGVVGVLKAASPVQVVVGSFIAEGKKPKGGSSSTPPPTNMLNFGTPGTSGGASSDSGDDNDESPLAAPGAPGSAPYGNSGGHPVHNVPIYSNMGWPNSIKM